MAKIFGVDPRVVDQEWDELWINRIMLVQEAEALAATAQRQRAIDESQKE